MVNVKNNRKGLDMELEVWDSLVMFGKKETEIMKVEPAPGQSALDQLLADPERLKEYPIETVERMFDLNLKLRAEEGRREFAAAFNRVQGDEGMKPVAAKGRNEAYKGSMYAKAEDVGKMLDPILVKHGFSWSLSHAECPHPEMMRIVLILRHVGGHEERHFSDAPADTHGPKGGTAIKTKLHGMASSDTFVGRNLRIKVFGLQIVKDDDGNAGANVGPSAKLITESQACDLEALIGEVGVDLAKFLAYAKIKDVREMPARQFKDAVRTLEEKRRSPK